MERLFSNFGRAAQNVRNAWAEISRREFYDGDLEVAGGDMSDLLFEKAMHYPISLTHLTSRTTLSYRRTSQHIRNNRVGFRVIWFVRQGSLKIVRTQGVCVIRATDALKRRSTPLARCRSA